MSILPRLQQVMTTLPESSISDERQRDLTHLGQCIQKKLDQSGVVRLNFICTHNSRRSHMAQVWAQTWAYYYGLAGIQCYSGGTAVTAVFPMVVEVLDRLGFDIRMIAQTTNPIYAIRYATNEPVIYAYSKLWNAHGNPQDSYIAVTTCSQADVDCPVIHGADERFSMHFVDPKYSDHQNDQYEVYRKTCLGIAQELRIVMSSLRSMVNHHG